MAPKFSITDILLPANKMTNLLLQENGKHIFLCQGKAAKVSENENMREIGIPRRSNSRSLMVLKK